MPTIVCFGDCFVIHIHVHYNNIAALSSHEGRPWPNIYIGCTTNIYKLDAYAGAPVFDPELGQYASWVRSPYGLTVVYKILPPLNLASRDIACTEWNRQ